jgi:chromosomal replication initiator protein
MQPADIIVFEVAWKHGVPVAVIKSPDAHRKVCHARWEAMARIRDERRWSYPKIGQYFGRDHTSVMHGVRKYHANV